MILRRIKSKPVLAVFLLFLFLHIGLLNINSAEWGDSYRILRASEYVKNFSYPSDEKRPPLFSAALALQPIRNLDPVIWGRVFMLGISIICFFLFSKIAKIIFKEDPRGVILSLLLFTLNPVILYWSLRIYADMFFTMWVLLGFLLVLQNKQSIPRIFLLAVVGALSIFTRFEGYILAGSLGLSLLIMDPPYWPLSSRKMVNALLYGVFLILLLLPYWIWRNPFDSSYFSETSTMSYDLKMVGTFFVSALYMFGFTSAGAFLLISPRSIWQLAKKYPAVSVFIVLELVLIFLWPAAIPRLFVPIIPFFILALTEMSIKFFQEGSKSLLPLSSILFLLFPLAQYFLKLQFLIPVFDGLLILLMANILILFFIFRRHFWGFTITICVSALLWSIMIIWLHKDIHHTLKVASSYAVVNLNGLIAHNDTSALIPWYLDNYPYSGSENNSGEFYPFFGESSYLSKEKLVEKGYDYLLISNEHLYTLEIDLEEYPHLELIRSYEKIANGRFFYTKVIEVKN